MTLKFIGIDPGVTGAIALLPEGRLWDTPTAEVRSGKKTRTAYLPRAMANIIEEAIGSSAPEEVICALEHQQPWRGQGLSSMGSILRCYGLWEGILASLGVVYSCPAPKDWKRAMLAGMGKEKSAAVVRAQQLFPALAAELERPKERGSGVILLDGRAEALLLAVYAQREGFTNPFKS